MRTDRADTHTRDLSSRVVIPNQHRRGARHIKDDHDSEAQTEYRAKKVWILGNGINNDTTTVPLLCGTHTEKRLAARVGSHKQEKEQKEARNRGKLKLSLRQDRDSAVAACEHPPETDDSVPDIGSKS